MSSGCEERSRLEPASWTIATAAILLAVVVAYWPAFLGGFVFDDPSLLEACRAPLRQIWTGEVTPDYLPLTWTTFWIESHAWGTNPLGYHATNVALHALTAVLLWRALRALEVRAAWLAGMIFAVHPVTVESAAWISERKNTLSAVLFLGAILTWARARDGGRRHFAASVLLFAAALLSKASVVMLPVVLLGIAWRERGRIDRRDVARTAPFFLLALVAGVVTIWFQHTRAVELTALSPRGLLERAGGAGAALASYLEHALLPFRLGFLYPEWPVSAGSPLFYVPLVLVVAAALVLWRARTRWAHVLGLALGYHVIMLLPVIGLLDMAWLQFSPVSNHLQYLALMGPVALVATGIDRLARSGHLRSAGFVAAGVLALCCAGTMTRSQAFESDLRLWESAVREQPDSAIARYELAMFLLADGRRLAATEQLGAMARVARDPVLQARGRALWLIQNGRYAEAATIVSEVNGIRPDAAFVLDVVRQLARAGATLDALRLVQPLARAAPGNREYASWEAALVSAMRGPEAQPRPSGR